MKKISIQLLSLILALLMLVGAMPFAVFAQDGTEPTQEETAKKDPGFTLYSALPQMSEGAIAGIYVDGKLVYEDKTNLSAEGATIKVFAKALQEYAASTRKDGKYLSRTELDALPETRVVLNTDLIGEIEGLHRIEHKKLTIDLNGHILGQTKTKSLDKGVFDISSYLIGVTDGAQLTIVDSNPDAVHMGRVEVDGASAAAGQWILDAKGTVPIQGGIIYGYCNGKTLDVGICGYRSRLIMKGGTIAGFKAKDDVLAWVANSDGMNNGNYAELSWGAAFCYNEVKKGSIARFTAHINVKKRIILLDDTVEFFSNRSCGYSIVKYHNISATGGKYYKNELASEDKNAGVVRVHGGKKDYNVILSDMLVENNRGTGISIAVPNEDASSTVKNCTSKGNYCNERGGGMIVSTERVSIESCTITGNASKEHGGGILVKPGARMGMSGLMTVKDNYKCSYEVFGLKTATDKSNLYLQGNKDLAVSSLEIGSEVWIRTGKPAAEYLGKNNPITPGGHEYRTGVSPYFFYVDNESYYVVQVDEPTHKNHRSLCLVQGKRPENSVKELYDYAPHELSEKYKTASGLQFPLIKGYFEYNLMTTSDYSSASPFYYSDGYFVEDPLVYNEHLATMSINLAVAAFGRSTEFVPGNEYANHFANVKQLFADMGCDDDDFYANDDYQNEPKLIKEENRLSTIAAAMTQKKIEIPGDEYTLIPVAIRGGSYGAEWASNVTIGKTGEATGFADAADQVYAEIEAYLKREGLEDDAKNGKIKFWIVGYSRAGATANLCSKRLVDTYGAMGNQVFGYTFEAPMGGVEEEKLIAKHTNEGKYLTIHNTVNENDFVTLVAPSQMGFIRYGVDHLVGSETKNGVPVSYDKESTYWKRREAMRVQLAAINPYFVFNDAWVSADLNLYFGLADMDPLTEPKGTDNENYLSMYRGIRAFFERVQWYGLNSRDEEKYRELYSENKLLAHIDKDKNDGLSPTDKNYSFRHSDYSIEQALQALMGIFFTMSDADMSAMLDAMMTNLNAEMDSWFFGSLSKMTFLDNYLLEWTLQTRKSNATDVDILIGYLMDGKGGVDPWKYLTKEQQSIFAEAFPVVLYFVFDFISRDYDRTGITYNTGSFVHNMDAIISNHYQEVSVAWVRSYDDYYANDTTAYMIKREDPKAPVSTFSNKDKTMTLTAEAGGSIYYSADGGEKWVLYEGPVTFEQIPDDLLTFVISRGHKSETVPVSTNTWSGSLFGNGNVWFVVIGAALIVAGAVITAEVVRRKRKEEQAS